MRLEYRGLLDIVEYLCCDYVIRETPPLKPTVAPLNEGTQIKSSSSISHEYIAREVSSSQLLVALF
jgi:hypothetical protein